MERTRAQMIHAGVPNQLWGEFIMATSQILNLSPTRSVNDIPINLCSSVCSGSDSHQADVSFLWVLGCQACSHVPKSQHCKLDPTATPLIHVGYEVGAKAYRLWDLISGKNCYLLWCGVQWNYLSHAKLNTWGCIGPIWRRSWRQWRSQGLSTIGCTCRITCQFPSVFSEEPQPTAETPLSRPTRSTRAPTRYSNVVSYSAARSWPHDPDNPTYSQEMLGPDKDEWRKSMEVEFRSLLDNSVGRLISWPKSANVLGGMWCFKRKRNASGNISKYSIKPVGSYLVIIKSVVLTTMKHMRQSASKSHSTLPMLWPQQMISNSSHLTSSPPSLLDQWMCLNIPFKWRVSRMRVRTFFCWINPSTVQNKCTVNSTSNWSLI